MKTWEWPREEAIIIIDSEHWLIFILVFQCPDLGDSIENGKVVVTPTARTVNSTAEYSCNDGYKLNQGDVKRICQAGGIWSGEGPQCSE